MLSSRMSLVLERKALQRNADQRLSVLAYAPLNL
jgi:hypothetical protein